MTHAPARIAMRHVLMNHAPMIHALMNQGA
jgi:hypothetical protein